MKVGTDGVLLGCWAQGGGRILDIGTGTGLIALIMAQRFAQAQIDAIDIDPQACAQAKENVEASPFAAAVQVNCADMRTLAISQPYDAIVCNPPFFISSLQCPDHRRTMARHADTLSPRDLIGFGHRALADGGTMSVVVPADQASLWVSESVFAGMAIAQMVRIKTTESKPAKRILLALTKDTAVSCQTTEQTLMTGSKKSDWYQSLTADFYL